jgi:hypothetical protein
MAAATLHISPPGSYASHGCRGYTGKGSRLARRAASYVRAGVDSLTESRLRMLLVLGGLPEPQVNHILRDHDGEWASRLDLCYPELKLIIEYDGRHHTQVGANWLNDLKRREALEREGWRLVIVTAKGIYDTPMETLVAARTQRARMSSPFTPNSGGVGSTSETPRWSENRSRSLRLSVE